jgi:signal peptidase I
MNPTLKTGDRLNVEPYDKTKIHIGDVVVFMPPGQGYNVVHRIIYADPEEVRTRGDNNGSVDPWTLKPEDIIGRVISIQRLGVDMEVHGGTRGRMIAPALWMWKRIKLSIFRTLHHPYQWLVKSGVFKKILPRNIKMRILSFQKPHGVEMYLLMGDLIVGKYLPLYRSWRIRRPFRLFIDESSLPERTTAPPN